MGHAMAIMNATAAGAGAVHSDTTARQRTQTDDSAAAAARGKMVGHGRAAAVVHIRSVQKTPIWSAWYTMSNTEFIASHKTQKKFI